jgi:hypothetical protein
MLLKLQSDAYIFYQPEEPNLVGILDFYHFYFESIHCSNSISTV